MFGDLLGAEKHGAGGEKVNSRPAFPSKNQRELDASVHRAHKGPRFKSLLNLSSVVTPSLPSLKSGSSGI